MKIEDANERHDAPADADPGVVNTRYADPTKEEIERAKWNRFCEKLKRELDRR